VTHPPTVTKADREAAVGSGWYRCDAIAAWIDTGDDAILLELTGDHSELPKDAFAFATHREATEAAIVAWLRTTPRACGEVISIHSSTDVARLANAIERG
jgi:hypothetical protein